MGWRISAIKAALSGNPEGMQRFFASRMRDPPDRNTAEFLAAYTRSPRFSPATKIATDLSVATGKLYRLLPDGSRDEITDHPFLDFMRRPNPLPYLTASAIWKVLETYLLIKGECNAIIERDPAGYPAELWPTPTNWVLDIPQLGYPYYIVRNREGLQREIPAADMYVVRQLNPTDPYGRGLGDAEPVADEIETDEYMAKWAKKFFYNDATPSVLVSAPGINKEEYERFQAAWNDRYRGMGNAHRVGIIPRDVAVNRLVESQREMDFSQSRKDLRDGVNSHFGVPPEILGIVENSNRATATQAKIIYAENVLTPRLLARQDAINRQLLAAWGEDLLWEYDDIVPEDTEFKLELANAGLSGSALTVDEWREQNGFDPLPGDAGKVLYVPFSALPTKPEELTEIVRDNVAQTGTGVGETGPEPAAFQAQTAGFKAGKRRRLQAAHRDRARLLAQQERAGARRMERFFARQQREILEAMQSGHKAEGEDFAQKLSALLEGAGLAMDISQIREAAREALEQLLDWGAQEEALTAALSPIWQEAFEAGAGSIRQIAGLDSVRAPSLTDYLRREGLKRAHGITETTRDRLANLLADGVEAGESTAQLVRRIQQELPDIQAERAATIALSEVHTSLQAGSFAQMQYAGVRTKTWITAGDEDVRDSHQNVAGETVPMEQRFSNGLLYPGDPAGSPMEIINCRCDMLPGDL